MLLMLLLMLLVLLLVLMLLLLLLLLLLLKMLLLLLELLLLQALLVGEGRCLHLMLKLSREIQVLANLLHLLRLLYLVHGTGLVWSILRIHTVLLLLSSFVNLT